MIVEWNGWITRHGWKRWENGSSKRHPTNERDFWGKKNRYRTILIILRNVSWRGVKIPFQRIKNIKPPKVSVSEWVAIVPRWDEPHKKTHPKRAEKWWRSHTSLTKKIEPSPYRKDLITVRLSAGDEPTKRFRSHRRAKKISWVRFVHLPTCECVENAISETSKHPTKRWEKQREKCARYLHGLLPVCRTVTFCGPTVLMMRSSVWVVLNSRVQRRETYCRLIFPTHPRTTHTNATVRMLFETWWSSSDWCLLLITWLSN